MNMNFHNLTFKQSAAVPLTKDLVFNYKMEISTFVVNDGFDVKLEIVG